MVSNGGPVTEDLRTELEARDAEIRRLNEQLGKDQTARDRRDELQDELKLLKSQLRQAEKEGQQCENQLATHPFNEDREDVQDPLAVLREELASLKKQVRQAKTEIYDADRCLVSAEKNPGHQSRVETKVRLLRGEVGHLRREKAKQENTVRKTAQQLQELEMKLGGISTNIQRCSRDLHAAVDQTGAVAVSEQYRNMVNQANALSHACSEPSVPLPLYGLLLHDYQNTARAMQDARRATSEIHTKELKRLVEEIDRLQSHYQSDLQRLTTELTGPF